MNQRAGTILKTASEEHGGGWVAMCILFYGDFCVSVWCCSYNDHDNNYNDNDNDDNDSNNNNNNNVKCM